ncbi:hypothetical protein Q5752_006385 [Cryptotrichosporon argae]
MSVVAFPEWQNEVRARLMAAQQAGDGRRDVVEQYRRLSKTARDLRIRNRALLRGGGGVGGGGEGSTPAPLVAHLDAELTALRAELSTLYRTQAAAQNRQLSMADALRDRDEEVRVLREDVRELRDARDAGAKRERNWEERWRMRDEDVRTLHDEILSQQIEISALGQRNAALQADNASLLQRWLDKMNLAADEMNAGFAAEAGSAGPGAEAEAGVVGEAGVAGAAVNGTTAKASPAKDKGKAKEGFR